MARELPFSLIDSKESDDDVDDDPGDEKLPSTSRGDADGKLGLRVEASNDWLGVDDKDIDRDVVVEEVIESPGEGGSTIL
jgi:hypothetical protein